MHAPTSIRWTLTLKSPFLAVCMFASITRTCSSIQSTKSLLISNNSGENFSFNHAWKNNMIIKHGSMQNSSSDSSVKASAGTGTLRHTARFLFATRKKISKCDNRLPFDLSPNWKESRSMQMKMQGGESK